MMVLSRKANDQNRTILVIYSNHRPTSFGIITIKKKVWRRFVYLIEGCGEPEENKRCNTPHLIDMGYGYTRSVPCHILTRNECCPLSSLRRKLPHFQLRTVRKHFQYACQSLDTTKIENNFHKRTTLARYCKIMYVAILYDYTYKVFELPTNTLS